MEPTPSGRIRAVAEMVGLAAVVGSLIFVGLELRQNTVATRAEANASHSDGVRDLSLALATSSELAEAIARMPLDPNEAEATDKVQLLAWNRALFHSWANTHRQALDGTLSPGFLEGLQSELSAYSSAAKGEGADLELVKRWNLLRWAWSIEHTMFDQSFQEFMDSLLGPSQ